MSNMKSGLTKPGERPRDSSRCTLCGAPRIPLNREKTRFGVCTFIECKDPMHDVNAAKPAPESAETPRPFMRAPDPSLAKKFRQESAETKAGPPKCGRCKTRSATHFCLEADAPRCDECDGMPKTELEAFLDSPDDLHVVAGSSDYGDKVDVSTADPAASVSPAPPRCCGHSRIWHDGTRCWVGNCDCGADSQTVSAKPEPSKGWCPECEIVVDEAHMKRHEDKACWKAYESAPEIPQDSGDFFVFQMGWKAHKEAAAQSLSAKTQGQPDKEKS